jgi:methylated-DNA-[protein]-cysteine S-methyltransferase
MLRSTAIDSPVGRLTISATDDAIVAITWRGEPFGERNALLVEAQRQLEAYFTQQLTVFDLPLMPAGSAFDNRVWQAMRQIPHGQTRSYGELAMEIGSAPRAIGGACGRNPIPIMIPCHRVLARNLAAIAAVPVSRPSNGCWTWSAPCSAPYLGPRASSDSHLPG